MKIVKTLPQDREDEAINLYNGRTDMFRYDAGFLLKLSKQERNSPEYEIHWKSMASFIYGYAAGKRWPIQGGCDDALYRIVNENPK